MTEIIDIKGEKHEIDCIACAIQSGKIMLPVERIKETKNFVVEQDLEWPIEGFLVIVSKRHVLSVDEMTDEEMEEFSQLLKKTRAALRKIAGVSAVTLVLEEATTTSHFHLWLFPWHKWMGEKWNGKLAEIKDIMKYAKSEFLNEADLEKIRKTAILLREEMM